MSLRRLNILRDHLLGNFNFSQKDDSLDSYRNRGMELNPKVLRHAFIEIQPEVYDEACQKLSQMPSFTQRDNYELSRSEMRALYIQQIKDFFSLYTIDLKSAWDSPEWGYMLYLVLFNYDQPLGVRLGVHMTLYQDTLVNLGTEKHRPLIDNGYALREIGCFAMTEIGHGTNVMNIGTTAHYDNHTRQFVLNTPSSHCAKWWIGAAALTANKAIVFAQLYVENVNKGVHAFVVDIRNYETHELLPGVKAGDCGPKAGSHGIDNGFLIFENYRVPYDCLLDKLGHITVDGKYKSSIKKPEKRFAASLAGLIRGRLGVLIGSTANLRNALTIALRYSAVRRQFGGSSGIEQPILDYPLQRYRLIPHLANLFASSYSSNKIFSYHSEISSALLEDPEIPQAAELHCILSVFKYLATSYAQKGIQECREACGGHGYSAFAGLGQLRDNNDINLTWEGDNNVLIQQTARFILKNIQKMIGGRRVEAKTLDFLNTDLTTIMNSKAEFKTKQEITWEKVRPTYIYNVAALIQKSVAKLQEHALVAKDVFDAWNKTQVYYLQDVSIAYGELVLSELFFEKVEKTHAVCPKTAEVMRLLQLLYVLTKLEKSVILLTEGHMTSDQFYMIREKIIELCDELGEASIKIIDAIANPDFFLRSALGVENGQIYARYMDLVEKAQGVYAKPSWFSELQAIRSRTHAK